LWQGAAIDGSGFLCFWETSANQFRAIFSDRMRRHFLTLSFRGSCNIAFFAERLNVAAISVNWRKVVVLIGAAKCKRPDVFDYKFTDYLLTAYETNALMFLKQL
jgi:hypothetical protein